MAGTGSERTTIGGARGRFLVALVAALGALLLAGNAFAGGPTITSDQADYAPGSTVTLTGSGWGVGESVHVTVDDSLGQTWSWASDPDPVAGLDGTFSATLTLPNYFVSDYSVHAVGSSGASADAAFTDSSMNIKDSSNNNHNSNNPLVIGTTAPGGSLTSSVNVVISYGTGKTGTWTLTDAGTQPSGASVTFGQTTGANSATVSFTLGTSVLTPTGTYTERIHLHGVSTDNNNNVFDDDLYYRYAVQSKANQATLSITGPASATFGAADQAITTSGGSGGGAVTFDAGSSTACSISGSNFHVTSGTGTCSITATKAGDATYNPTTSAVFAVTINKASQTITFAQPTTPQTYGATFIVNPTASSGLPVGLSGTNGVCSVSPHSGGGFDVTMLTGTGTCTLLASQTGDGDYSAASNVSHDVTAQKASQTITFAQPTTPQTYNSTFHVGPSSSSGLPVSLSGTTGVCSVTPISDVNGGGFDVTMLTGTGTCTLTASQAGDANYNAAGDVSRDVEAQKVSQTIGFGALGDKTFGDPAFTVSATGGDSGNPITFSATGDCTSGGANGATITITGAGSCTITADQAGNDNYSAAPPVPQSFDIGKASSTTTVSCAAGPFIYDGSAQTPCSVSVTGAGGLNLIPDPDYANNSNAGMATASYTYAGDANHFGSSDSQNFTIGKASSTTTVSCAVGPFIYDGSAQTPCSVSVTGAGGLNLIPDPDYANNSNAGMATASYTYAGDANHFGSSDSQNFTISRRSVAASITAVAKVYDGTVGTTASCALNAQSGDVGVVTGQGSAVIDCATSNAQFDTAAAGSGKTVTASVALTGTGADNYSLSSGTATDTSSISRRSVTASITAVAKVYDGTVGTTASCALNAQSGDVGVVAGQGSAVIDCAASNARFDTAAAGSGKTVTASVALTGTGADNYSLSSGTTTDTSSIYPKQLTVTANDQAMVINGAVPLLTYAITGYVANESFGTSSGVSGVASCTTAGGTTIGTFPIVCTQGTLDGGTNYRFVAGVPAAGSFASGTLTVTYVASGTCNGAPGHAILQPVNADGTSVFKQGSTVPAKFRVCDANGVSIGTPGVVSGFRYVTQVGTLVGSVDEAVDSTTPDTAFRWSSTDQQWIFNISTKSLSKNVTYLYTITLNDKSAIKFQFGLK